MEWMLMPYRKLYRLIEGRSGRREFWMFTLFVLIVTILMILLMAGFIGGTAGLLTPGLDSMAAGGALAGAGVGVVVVMAVFYVWMLLTGVASFAVTIRRLHDLNFSGWFLLLYYAVLIVAALISPYLYLLGAVAGLVVMALPGTQGPNKYGSDPSAPDLDVEAFA